MNSIFYRRSVRKFENRTVEAEKIELLLKAAMSAPSARNQRAWEFIVVTEREILSDLSKVSRYAGAAGAAPLAIVPVADEDRMTCLDYFEQDMAAATENILVEAVELELGAVWLGIAPREDRMEKVSEILGLPSGVKPFSIIAVGYPAEEPDIRNTYDSSKVHYNVYKKKSC